MSGTQEVLKLGLVGNLGVGKSCMFLKFSDNTERHITTIGVNVKSKIMEIDGKSINLQLWDTTGQERFGNISGKFFKNADGFLVVYDVTDSASFSGAKIWFTQVCKFIPTSIKVLVGNKCDAIKHRAVSFKTGKEFADSIGVPFFETSAKFSINVIESFLMLATKSYEVRQLQKDVNDNNENKIEKQGKKEKCSLQ